MGINFHGQKGNNPDHQLRSLIITKWERRWRFTNNQEVGLEAPAPLRPWFDLDSPVLAAGYRIAFGHWASLEGRGTPAQVYALDTGCCWGGTLTALRWEDGRYFHVPSQRAARHGKEA